MQRLSLQETSVSELLAALTPRAPPVIAPHPGSLDAMMEAATGRKSPGGYGRVGRGGVKQHAQGIGAAPADAAPAGAAPAEAGSTTDVAHDWTEEVDPNLQPACTTWGGPILKLEVRCASNGACTL
jgi:hypothetical protein